MRFAFLAGMRFLREGRIQSLLILAGVTVGVAVIVFLSALIGALQSTIIDRTLGSQAHIVVSMPDEEPRAMLGNGRRSVLSRVERPAQRLRSIEEWQQVARQVAEVPRVTEVSPVVAGDALATRGEASRSVFLRGIDPGPFARIIDVPGNIKLGRYDVSGSNALVGKDLAEDLGLAVGDKLRILTVGREARVFTVTGTFDLGMNDVNERWVLVSLPNAQTMLDLVGGISALELQVDEIFEAREVAEVIRGRTGLKAESWMETNTQLLTALRSQDISSGIIRLFVVLAVALGIASVLAVSVVQKGKEIGILRAMGTSAQKVMAIFLVQGAVLGLVGSGFGTLLGVGLATVFTRAARNEEGEPLFPIQLTSELLLGTALLATLIGVLSALLPARQAARTDPATVIRNG